MTSCSKVKTVKAYTDYIPEGTKIIFKINDLAKTKKIFQDNGLVNEIHAEKIINYFSLLLKQDSSNLHRSILCLSESTKGQFTYTMIAEVNHLQVSKGAFNKIEIENSDQVKEPVYEEKFNGNLTYSLQKDSILIISSSKKVIEKIVLNQNHQTDKKNFDEAVRNPSGKPALKILLYGGLLPKFYGKILPHYKQTMISPFPRWTSVNIDVVKDSIFITSMLESNPSQPSVTDLFEHTQPQKIKSADVIPFKSEGFVSFTYNNYGNLRYNLLNFSKKDRVHSFDTVDDLLGAASEVSLVFFRDESALVLFVDNVFDQLRRYRTEKVGRYWQTDIYQFRNPQAFEKALHPLVQNTKANYFFSFRNAIVFTETLETLKMFIMDNTNGTTIKNINPYKGTLKNMPDKASIFVFRPPRHVQIQSKGLEEKSNQDFWKGIDNDDHYTVSLNLGKGKRKKRTKLELLFHKTTDNIDLSTVDSMQTIQLDKDLISAPILVKSNNRNEMNILVQDIENNLSLLSNKGELIWKKELAEEVLGKIHQIKLKNVAGYCYAFSTKSSLYLIGTHGDDLENYPKKFEKPITQPLSIFDIGKTKNYQFVISQDHITTAFNTDGNQIKYFHYDLKKSVINPPKYLKVRHAKLVVFQVENGRLYLMNPNGGKRIKVKDKIDFSQNEWYSYENALVSTTKKGQLVTIGLDGNISYKTLNLKPHHKFLSYQNKLVTLSGDVLSIDDAKVALKKDSKYTDPKVLKLNNHHYINVTNTEKGEVYIYDEQGSLFPGFPVRGNSEVSLGDMDGDSKNEFTVLGNKNEILIYKIKY